MNHLFRSLLPFLPLLILSSCATTTRIVSSEKAPGRPRPVHAVLVVGVTARLQDRHRFEDEFARNLTEQGLTAYPSYAVIASTALPSCDNVTAAIKERGIDTILITRFIDQKETTTSMPGDVDYLVAPYPDQDFFGYYQSGIDYVTRPGYTVVNRTVVLRTNLYDASNQKLFWSATTNTTTQADNASIVNSFIRAIVKRMKKDGLL